MTYKVYDNFSSKTVQRFRAGHVGNGLKSNNDYRFEIDLADGKFVTCHDGWVGYQPPSQSDENRLYAKLVEAVNRGAQGELLTAAAEWKSSLDMVTRRTLWILESYKSFRRFDLPATVKKLYKPVVGPGYTKTFRKNERGFTSFNRRSVKWKKNRPTVTETWLEYWLGWAPAMGDIYNALDVLQREFPNQHISVATGYRNQYVLEDSTLPLPYVLRRQTNYQGVLGAYADAQVTNYNLHLANQLGLVNPAATGFDLIPFSFVLGWFINVKQVLSYLTDFAGVSLTNRGMGIYQTRESRQVHRFYRWAWDGPDYVYKYHVQDGGASGVTKIRAPGASPVPRLVCKFDRLSLTRAATAVSLLVEVFLRKRD